MFTYITTTTVPAFVSLQTQFSASLEQINWTLAIPALGLAVGPLLWSSPADIIGRRPIMILGTLISIAATIGAAKASSYSNYMCARFFQGLGVSPAATVGLAIINDIFFEHERGQKVGLWVLAIDLGLLFGPLIGGFMYLVSSEWIQWLTAILLGAILLAEVLFMPETLYPRDWMLSRQVAAAGGGGTKVGMVDAVGAEEEEKEKKKMTTTGTMSREGGGGGDVKRTKGLPYINVVPLPGMKHPKVWDTLIRFGKTFKFAVVPIAIFTYCFGWYWWVLSVITLIPVAYATYSPQIQGYVFPPLFSPKFHFWQCKRKKRKEKGTTKNANSNISDKKTLLHRPHRGHAHFRNLLLRSLERLASSQTRSSSSSKTIRLDDDEQQQQQPQDPRNANLVIISCSDIDIRRINRVGNFH